MSIRRLEVSMECLYTSSMPSGVDGLLRPLSSRGRSPRDRGQGSPAEANSAASAVAPATRAPPQPSPRPAIEGGGVVGIPPAVAAGRDGAELEAQLRAACIQSMWQRMRLDSPRRSGGRRDG